MSTTAKPLAPEYPVDEEADPTMAACPILDATKTTCNCSNYPMTGKVIIDTADFVVPETQATDIPSLVQLNNDGEQDQGGDEGGDEGGNEEADGDVQLFAEMIQMKGSSFHKHFQEALSACKQIMLDGNVPQLSLHQEPTNARDENAIIVKAMLGVRTPIGYIPGPKVPKVKLAMERGEIASVTLNNVIYRFVFCAQDHRYFAKVLLLKRNRWLPDSPTYTYNQII